MHNSILLQSWKHGTSLIFGWIWFAISADDALNAERAPGLTASRAERHKSVSPRGRSHKTPPRTGGQIGDNR